MARFHSLGRLAVGVAAAIGALAAPLAATLVPRMSLDQVVASSQDIVHGVVVRSWSAWDSGRQAIWTHYEVRISDSLKGQTLDKIVLSEPGGEVDGVSMQVAGAPRYAAGEEVVVFATSTPIGYLRTCGWTQGKFQVKDGAGGSAKLVRGGPQSVTLIEAPAAGAAEGSSTPLSSVEGMPLEAFKALVRKLAASQGAR